jgi:hypothetical protein
MEAGMGKVYSKHEGGEECIEVTGGEAGGQ